MAHLTRPEDITEPALAPTLGMERQSLLRFGLRMRKARAAGLLSMRSLSELLDIRQDVISRIEAGVWMPTEDEVEAIEAWLATLE